MFSKKILLVICFGLFSSLSHAERLIVGGSEAKSREEEKTKIEHEADKEDQEAQGSLSTTMAIGFFNPESIHVDGGDKKEIAEKIKSAARQVAKDHHLGAIFPSNIAVYSDDNLDVTDAMQEAIEGMTVMEE